MDRAWNRRANENSAEYLYFQCWLTRSYLDSFADKKRSLLELADYFRLPLVQLREVAIRNDWEARTAEYDQEQIQKRVRGELDAPPEFVRKRSILLDNTLALVQRGLEQVGKDVSGGKKSNIDFAKLLDITLHYQDRLYDVHGPSGKTDATSDWDLSKLSEEELAVLDKIRRKCVNR